MSDDNDNWNQQHFGKAQKSFNEAAQGKEKQPAKEVETGKAQKPPVLVPKPPGMGGQSVPRQAQNDAFAARANAGQTLKPKKEISLEDQKAIEKLNERLRQAAARERKNDRDR